MVRKKSTPKRKAVHTVVVRPMRKRKGSTLARAKKRARLEVGLARVPKMGFKTRTTHAEDTSAIARRILYIREVTDIPFGTAVNERARDTIMIKGFKLRFHVKVPAAVTIPYIFRMAIISAKNNTVATTNFFKGYDADHGLTFDSTRLGLELTTSQINPREYTTLWQGKIRLSPGNQNASPAPYNKWKDVAMVSKYIPLNRILQFDNSGAGSPDSDRCFLVYWLDDPLSPTGTTTLTDQALIQNTVVCYFKDNN